MASLHLKVEKMYMNKIRNAVCYRDSCSNLSWHASCIYFAFESDVHHCICALLVAESALPMMQNIADTMTYLQGEGRLLRAEHNHLCEAFLVMASSAGYLAATPFDIYAYDYG